MRESNKKNEIWERKMGEKQMGEEDEIEAPLGLGEKQQSTAWREAAVRLERSAVPHGEREAAKKM